MRTLMEIFHKLKIAYAGMNGRQLQLLNIVLVVLLGTAAYSNSLHVPLIMDDSRALLAVSSRSAAQIFHDTARPIADISFLFNYRLHNFQLAGYHLVNLAIHLATAVTLYALLVSAFAALRRSCTAGVATFAERFVPFAAALLFVSHPVQTQAVTYIVQRSTGLATLFYLLSVLFFISGRNLLEVREQRGMPWLLFGFSLVAGLLAFGSKQIALTLPLMLVVLELFLFRGRLLNRKFFLLLGVFGAVGMVGLLAADPGASFLNKLLSATSETDTISRTDYFLTEVRVVASYLRLLYLPLGQSLVWSPPVYTSILALPVLASSALHVFLLSVAALLFRQSKHNFLSDNGQSAALQRLAALGIVWFYGSLLIESSIFPIADVMVEHRMYLPSVGFFMTVTAGAALAVQRNEVYVKWLWLLLLILCLVLGGLTIARNQKWHDALVLYQEALNKFPDSDLALMNISEEYLQRDMPHKALPHIVRLIELTPQLTPYVKVYLGKTLRALNVNHMRFATGEEFFRPNWMETPPMDYSTRRKWDGLVSNNLALAHEYLGNTTKAMEYYEGAIKVNPDYDLLWYNRALLAIRLGDVKRAGEAVTRLKTLNPVLAGQLAGY
jgi:hypothetical protein